MESTSERKRIDFHKFNKALHVHRVDTKSEWWHLRVEEQPIDGNWPERDARELASTAVPEPDRACMWAASAYEDGMGKRRL